MASLNLRLPTSLHTKLRTLAAAEGISLNQFIVIAVAEKAAILESGELGYLRHRADRVSSDARVGLLALMSKAGDEEPAMDDRL